MCRRHGRLRRSRWAGGSNAALCKLRDCDLLLMQILRLLMLRVLPRRLIPILTVVELAFLVLRMRRRGRQPVAPRKLVTVEGPERPER